MPKTKISEYSATANSNTDVASINIDEGCAPSGINNAIRAVMGHLKDFQQGTNGDPFNGPVNGTVGATTPSTGAFTTLSASGVFNNSRAAGADTYINHITTGINNTVMGFNNSGATNGSGVTNNTSYIGSLNAYSTWVVGNGATIAKFVSSAQGDQGLIVNGVVGIGTTSPTGRLTVADSTSSVLTLRATSAVDTDGRVIGTINFQEPEGTGDGTLAIEAAISGLRSGTDSFNSGGRLAFYTRPFNGTLTQAMTLDASGNLLVGTTSQAGRLTIKGASGSSGFIEAANGSNTPGTNGAVIGQNSDNGAYFWNRYNEFLSLGTNNTERARIDSSGNLLVNTTSAVTTTVGSRLMYGATDPYISSTLTSSSNATTSYLLYSTGAAAYRFYVGMGGTVYATNTTISAISDQRLKENIRDLDDGLASVMALKPRKFDWKEGKGANIKDARGFIAQEFETVFPDMIDEWKDPAPEGEEPYKAINANLIPTLVKAMQEQQAIIQSLTARITALEGA